MQLPRLPHISRPRRHPEPSSPTHPTQLRFNTLRDRAQSFFHGTSELERVPTSSSNASRKSLAPRLGLQVFSSTQLDIPALNTDVPAASRSPTSTRSLIDPASSPVGPARPITPQTFERLQTTPASPAPAYRCSPERGATAEEDDLVRLMTVERHSRRRRHHRRTSRRGEATRRNRCFPAVKDRAVRKKIISCLISGFLLAVILTLCKSRLVVNLR